MNVEYFKYMYVKLIHVIKEFSRKWASETKVSECNYCVHDWI